MAQDLFEFPDLPAILRKFLPFLLSFSASAQHTTPKNLMYVHLLCNAQQDSNAFFCPVMPTSAYT